MNIPENFEWDEKKNASNLEKHKIDFEFALQIFDGITLEKLDTRQNYEEARYIALGEAPILVLGEINGVILYVAYTWRGEKRRIISARKANKKEKEAYNAYQNQS
jgi:uncharacterized DUF497 family protein